MVCTGFFLCEDFLCGWMDLKLKIYQYQTRTMVCFCMYYVNMSVARLFFLGGNEGESIAKAKSKITCAH